MEELMLKYDAMQKALITLEKVLQKIDVLAQCDADDDIHILIRDSIIKRFEYCIDSFWKFLKSYLEEVQKTDVKVASPREIFRLSLQIDVITIQEHKILIEAISNRNLTPHTYNEVLANKIRNLVPLYFSTMKTIIGRLRIN